MSALLELQEWYLAHCNDEWEHGQGVRVETLDNPGWKLVVDLAGTELSGKYFDAVAVNCDAGNGTDDQHWFHCTVQSQKFTAYGGPRNLDTLLQIFLDWAKADHTDPKQ